MQILLKYWMAVTLILYCFIAIGQKENSPKADSLLIKLSKAESDSAKAKYLIAIGREIIEVNPDKALNYINEALNMYESLNDTFNIAATLNIKALIHFDKGEYESALKIFFEILPIAEQLKSNRGVGATLNNIGNVYLQMGKYEKALEFQLKSLELAIKINEDSLQIASGYNNVANAYEKLQKFETALEYHKLALQIRKEFNNDLGLTESYGNIGNVYREKKEYEKALLNLNKAIELSEKNQFNNKLSADLSNIAVVYFEMNQFEKAITYLKKSIDIAKELDLKNILTHSYDLLSKSYAESNQYKEAYEYHILYTELKDTILNESAFKSMAEMQTKYESEKKQQKIELLNKEKEKQIALSLAETKRKNTIIFSIVGGLILVTLFSIFLFNRFRVTNHQKIVIEEKQKEITDSITYAKRLQTAILPPDSYLKKYLPQSFVLYQPKDIVSGDFYWLETMNDLVLFAVADCTGHGVSGAMVSVVCSNALNRTVKEFGITEPAKILDKTRELVLETFEKSNEEVKDGMDISLCCLNTKTNELLWSGANNPLWYIRENNLFEIKGDKQPIGQNDNPKPFTTHSIDLQQGDTIYIFTDGYADQFGGEKGKKFMYRPLKELLLSLQNKPIIEQQEELHQKFTNWKKNTEQTDDVLVIGFKI